MNSAGQKLIAAAVIVAVLGGPVECRAQRQAAVTGSETARLPGMKSEGNATLLSFASTFVPTALGIVMMNSDENGGGAGSLGALLFSYGVYFGPATGYWYAGVSGAAWKGTGIRLGISLATAGAMAAICSGGNCDIFSGDDGAMTAAAIIGLAGLGAIAASLIHDIAVVDNHVRDRNAEIAARHGGSRLSISPVVSPVDGGTVGVLGRLRL